MHFWFAAILGALGFIVVQIAIIGGHMAKQEDVDALVVKVEGLTAQLGKVRTEVTAVKDQLAVVQAALEAAGSPVDLTALSAAVDGAVAAVQAVDDLNPDAAE